MRSHRVSPTNHPWPPLTVCHARVPARRFVGFGLALTIGYTAVLSIFYFGLYEAGKTTEAPLKAVMAMIPMVVLTVAKMVYKLAVQKVV